jgi:ankyrin repeat protein
VSGFLRSPLEAVAVPQDPKTLSIGKLAKYGHFEELRRRAASVEDLDLAQVFDRAVTDFRTVRRNAGHRAILQWCIDQGLAFNARAGWLNQSIVCLAARYGNNEIIAAMLRRGLPENPFCRAAVGDVEFLERYASRHELSEVGDENGFNLLFACADSGLGRRDRETKRRLAEVCRLLLDHGVSPSHEVTIALPIFPAFLCASSGGNEAVMRLLLDHGGLTAGSFHQTLGHALGPHQRSGEPFYHIAELILQYGFDINARWGGRTMLHGAANRGAVKAVRWLLQHGADPNALDEAGRTPLHVSAQRNTSPSVIKLLIEAGSELNARDVSGRLPLDYARENTRAKVVAYLVSIGGP